MLVLSVCEWSDIVQYVVDCFKRMGKVAPNLDVLQGIHMVVDAWEEPLARTIFHY